MVPARKRGQPPGLADPTVQESACDPNRGIEPSSPRNYRPLCSRRVLRLTPAFMTRVLPYLMLSTVHISVLIIHRPSGSRPQTDNHRPAVHVVSPPALG